MSRTRRLTIVQAGSVGIAPEVAALLAASLKSRLKLRVEVREGIFLAYPQSEKEGEHSGAVAANGGGSTITDLPPWPSAEIVDALIAGFPGDDEDDWILAITAHDLMAPGRSYVFGEATVGGRWAVVSLARLGPPDTASSRLLDRLYKEAVHELGHLAGIGHCAGESCVMEISGTVSAIDARNSEFCPDCRAEFLRKQVEDSSRVG